MTDSTSRATAFGDGASPHRAGSIRLPGRFPALTREAVPGADEVRRLTLPDDPLPAADAGMARRLAAEGLEEVEVARGFDAGQRLEDGLVAITGVRRRSPAPVPDSRPQR